MSTIRNPVGPQPRNVYWRRRLLVLIGIVAVIVIIILIVVRPGGGKPAAVPTNKPSHSAVANVAACNPANVKVVGITDAVTYAAGVDPMISLSITNTGTAACSFSDGSDKQVYVITSGTEKIWSSKDCQSKPEAATTTLQPGVAVKSAPFAWSRTRSNPAACSATNPPQVIAGGASYHLTVTVNGVTSAKTDSPQFILK